MQCVVVFLLFHGNIQLSSRWATCSKVLMSPPGRMLRYFGIAKKGGGDSILDTLRGLIDVRWHCYAVRQFGLEEYGPMDADCLAMFDCQSSIHTSCLAARMVVFQVAHFRMSIEASFTFGSQVL